MRVAGFKRFLASGALAVTGLVGVLASTDLTPLVQIFVRNPASVPLALCLIGIGFGVVQALTNTRPGDDGYNPEPGQCSPIKTKRLDAGY
jgi:hypothetical protein